MNWITPHIAVGSLREVFAFEERALLEAGVTHVLNVIRTYRHPQFQSIEYAYYPWHDENNLDLLMQALNFVHQAVSGGGRVFIACGAGIERAPTTALAYLLYMGYSLEDAYEMVKRNHPQSQIRLHWLRDVGFLQY